MEEDGGLWVWKWKTREAKESLAVGTGLVEAPPSMHHTGNGKARAQTMHDQRTKTLKAAYKSRAATATHLPMTTLYTSPGRCVPLCLPFRRSTVLLLFSPLSGSHGAVS